MKKPDIKKTWASVNGWFSKMVHPEAESPNVKGAQIHSRIILTVIMIFVFFTIASLVFTVYSIDANGQEEILVYDSIEREKVKQNLKNFVQMAYTIVQANYRNANDKKYLEKYYGERLQNMIDVLEFTLNEKVQDVKRGKLTQAQAQEQAKNLITKMRYDNGVGYFWITDLGEPYPKMILEPTMPELNGKVLNDARYNNASGTDTNLFVKSVSICKTNGEGYIDFLWKKPGMNNGDSTQKGDVSKFGYVRLYKEWKWIIGTGIYLDQAIEDCKEKSKEDLRQMRYDGEKGYFWINDNTRPIPRLIMNPFLEKSEGKILTDKKYNRAYGEDINLYQAFLAACEETGDGFVNYKWDKRDGKELIENAPKDSYVKYFEPLGWVIGSGVYIDDIDRAIGQKVKDMEKQKTTLIINYFLISILLGGISIGILIWIIRRSYRHAAQKQEQEAEEAKAEATTTTVAANTNVQPVANGHTHTEDVVEAAGKLLKIFLSEQTKLVAFNQAIEKSEKVADEEELKALSSEIRKLAEEMKEKLKTLQEAKKD